MLRSVSAKHSHSRELVFHSVTNKNSVTVNKVTSDKAYPEK